MIMIWFQKTTTQCRHFTWVLYLTTEMACICNGNFCKNLNACQVNPAYTQPGSWSIKSFRQFNKCVKWHGKASSKNRTKKHIRFLKWMNRVDAPHARRRKIYTAPDQFKLWLKNKFVATRNIFLAWDGVFFFIAGILEKYEIVFQNRFNWGMWSILIDIFSFVSWGLLGKLNVQDAFMLKMV